MAGQRRRLRVIIAAGTGAALIAGAAHFERDVDRRETTSEPATLDGVSQTFRQAPAVAPRARVSRGS